MGVKHRASKWAVNLAKMSIVGLLIAWMVSTGKLKPDEMRIFYTSPMVTVASIAVWLLGPVLLGTWRWWLLLRGAGIHCKFLRTINLQLIGFFFNTAMPGAVGGDIVKALYIVKEQDSPQGKTPAMLSVLLDRIVGLIGLFVMGGVAALINLSSLEQNPVTRTLVNGLILVVVGAIVFLALIFVPYGERTDPFEKLFGLPVPGFSLVSGIYRSLRTYRDRPGLIFGTIGLSIIIQVMFLAFMGFIGVEMYGDNFHPNLLPTVFPFGTLVTAVPLAPGGLGVGHAAFDKLFAMVGLPGGANVFNIYALSQLVLNLLGIIPYLTGRKNAPQIDFDQV